MSDVDARLSTSGDAPVDDAAGRVFATAAPAQPDFDALVPAELVIPDESLEDLDGLPAPTGSLAQGEVLWSKVADALRAQLNESTWRTWFEGIRVRAFDGEILLLAVANPLSFERLSTSFRPLLDDAVSALGGAGVRAELVVEHQPAEPDIVVIEAQEASTERPAPSPATDSASRDADPGTRLNHRYTFDQFVIGPSNRFAHAAALAVAESPARSYNPLFIYGPSGLGKTHLLHAIGHLSHELFRTKRYRYVSTETMMNEFVDSMRAKSMTSFKRRYREVDVLLVDDIQFLERTEQLQEEFFHTFNDLYERGSQIVLSSDRLPSAIALIEERLRTRFESGLITEIQRPEFETRLAILQKKAESEGLEGIPSDVLGFIAENIVDNVRALEGSLIRVAAYSSLYRTPLTEELARQVLSDLLPAEQSRNITPELILDETAKMFGWTVDELCGPSRRRPLVSARQIGMYVFRELTDYSYPGIAKVFGGRDHTTVMWACDKVRAQMAEKPQVFDQVNDLINRIKHGSG